MHKHPKCLIPVLVAAAAIVAGAALMLVRADSAGPRVPETVLVCGTCHSMRQEVDTWQSSAHSNVACLQCHDESNSTTVHQKFNEINEDMADNNAQLPHTMPLKVSNERCLNCHDPQMPYLLKDETPPPVLATTASTDTGKPMAVKAMHDLHMNETSKLNCVDCHTDSAHGPAAGTTERRDAAHKACQTCHDQQQVKIPVSGSVSCAACHVNPADVAPADHKDSARWQGEHGKASLDNTCGQCHLDESAGSHVSIANPAAFPTATKDTCQSCHAGMTMPHPASFLATHGQQAKQAPAVCDACHSRQNVANPISPHASAAFCTACHDQYQHPTGWVAQHGSNVNENCAACHTLQGQQGQHNACAACHNSSDGTWHPKMWFVTHAKVADEKGEASCQKCHAEVKPSCSQCHTNK